MTNFCLFDCQKKVQYVSSGGLLLYLGIRIFQEMFYLLLFHAWKKGLLTLLGADGTVMVEKQDMNINK